MSCYAHSLAATRGFLSQGCVDLIREAVATLPEKVGQLLQPPTVIDLGAGSGTTACAVLAQRPEIGVVTYDIDAEAVEWAVKNIKAAGLEAPHWGGQVKDSAEAATDWPDASVDMLIVDADHTYEGVAADIGAWLPKLRPGAPVFFNDYDAADAPNYWPGVQQAVDEAVARGDLVFVKRQGWSCLCRRV